MLSFDGDGAEVKSPLERQHVDQRFKKARFYLLLSIRHTTNVSGAATLSLQESYSWASRTIPPQSRHSSGRRHWSAALS